MQRSIIGNIHEGKQLVQMEYTKRIISHCMQRTATITLSTIGIKDNQSHFCTTISRIEIHDIRNADNRSRSIFNHQSYLTVGIDIVGGIRNIIVKRITGIRHIGRSDIPQLDVVLDPIEQIQVFRLNSPQVYFGVHKCSFFRRISISASMARKYIATFTGKVKKKL